VRLLTDGSGAVSDRYAYEAFGGVLWQTGSTANAYQFTGERFSSDLGLYYLRARWYNQGTGRFLTRDPYPIDIHNPIEWNRYSYVANNPVNAVDPSGLTLNYVQPLQTVSVPAIPGVVKTTIVVLATFIVGYASVCAATTGDVIFCARKGRDKNDNDVLRKARAEAHPNGDICKILAEMHDEATSKAEKRAIETAQKLAGCRNQQKRGRR
jgi:RHS repeat-associated protein